jgi:hypothetical protein
MRLITSSPSRRGFVAFVRMQYGTLKMKNDNGGGRRKHLLAAIPFVALILWFAYLWFVSGVIPYVDRYPNGNPKATGYVERHGLSEYRKTGKWVTYHPNGVESGTGKYEDDAKVDSTWMYFDEAGKPVATGSNPH